MAWTLLALAGLFEVVWAIGLKYTEGFTRHRDPRHHTLPPRRGWPASA
ncbi:hypothetical protein KB879_24930 [Cupriavidus sp. KK10]|jgi:multidrug transporter EmrE-like cation transporter|nr:hypothetical protein KB879_24930 [Cupriavidus sp. KK10]